MSSVLAYFLAEFGCYTKQIFLQSILCYACRRCVEDFTEIKTLITVFNFSYSVSYKIYASRFWQLVCMSISIRLILFNERKDNRQNECNKIKEF